MPYNDRDLIAAAIEEVMSQGVRGDMPHPLSPEFGGGSSQTNKRISYNAGERDPRIGGQRGFGGDSSFAVIEQIAELLQGGKLDNRR